MNCTKEEFVKIVHSKHPHKWMSHALGPLGNICTVYALDTNGECQLSEHEQMRLASHVWEYGAVTKDVDGIFSASLHNTTAPFAVGNGTYTIPIPIPSAPYKYTVYGHMVGGGPYSYSGKIKDQQKLDREYPVTLKKCECRAHKVGSNKHSSWCEIKENA